MREFVVDLRNVSTFEGFVAAFNEGFCRHCGGHWHGRSWNAFHDYLSWPEQPQFRLVFRGWGGCCGLRGEDRRLLSEIFADNPQIQVVMAERGATADGGH
jgi:hypothetical protein